MSGMIKSQTHPFVCGFIVELFPGVWLDPWSGGKTRHLRDARLYKAKRSAKGALTKARRCSPYRRARITPVIELP